MVGGICVSIALCFYTFAVWKEFFNKTGSIPSSSVYAFAVGFTLDLGGTTYMSILAHNHCEHMLTLHGAVGFLALAVMGIHFLWAVGATLRPGQRVARLFHRYSVYAWLIWLLAFSLGLPKGKM